MKALKNTIPPSSSAATKNTFDLPSHDALARILPNCNTHHKEAKTEFLGAAQQQEEETPADTQANKPNINHTYHIRHPRKRPPLHDFTDSPQITNLQVQEVEDYRLAMSRMAEDIIALRTQVVTLEAEKNQLHLDLSPHQNLGRDLLEDADIDVMTKAEMTDLINSLKVRLASENSKVASQRARVQQLQNDLNQMNNTENEFVKFRESNSSNRMIRMATLEATLKQQERIIETMHKALDENMRRKDTQTGDMRLVANRQRGEADRSKEETALSMAAENPLLKEELDRISQQNLPTVIQLSPKAKDTQTPKEKLILMNKLEKAEARVQTLEAQLEENCKLWCKHKQEMLTKQNERRLGFVRTSTTIFPNGP